jgi:beta-glucanase (GH16 family)
VRGSDLIEISLLESLGNRRRKMRSRFGLLACLICLACAQICRAASPPPPNLPGKWNLSFDDEFNSSLNTTTWKTTLWDLSNLSLGGSEVERSSAVSVSNGLLNVTASKQNVGTFNYVGGVVDTGPTLPNQPTGYSFLYGYAEASIKLVSGTSLWPGFWMLPDPNPAGAYHDADGEIDIMEELGQQNTLDEVHYHQGPNQWGTAINTAQDLSAGFHTYAVNWQPGKIDYYFDGSLVDTIDESPNVPMYLIFDMAVGASTTWPGAPDANTPFPSSMQVDDVRVWQTVPEPSSALLAMSFTIPLLMRRFAKRERRQISDKN